MRLIKLILTSFGKYENYEYNPNENLNELYLANGSGKSTLLNFIIVMFYGAGDNKTKEWSYRKLYLPWGKNEAIGSIIFEKNGKKYRIDKQIGKSAKYDKSSLYDLDLGKEIMINDDSYGFYFFKLDLESFKETLFLKSNDLLFKGTYLLNTYLINNISSLNDDISFDTIKDKISEYDKIVNCNNRFSKAYKLSLEYKEALAKLNELYKKNQINNDLLKENSQLEKENNLLVNQKNELINIIKYNEIKEKYQKYQYYLVLKEKYDKAIKETLDLNEYDSLIEKLEEISKKEKKILFNFKNILFLFISILIFAIVFFLGYKNNNLYYLFIILSFIPFALFLNSINKIKKENKKLENEQNSFYKRFNFNNYLDTLNYLKTKKKEKQYECLKDIDNYNKFIKDNDVAKLVKEFVINDEYENIKDYKEIYENVSEKIRINEIRIASNLGKITSNTYSYQINNLISKVSDIKEKLDYYQKENEALEICKTVFMELKNDISLNFTPELKENFINILNEITNSHFNDLIISNDFKISLSENNNTLKDINYFSFGYKDLIYLSLRLAIIKMSIKDDNLPLFIDDAFISLDKDNLKLVKNYFYKLAKNKQIFYFASKKILG